MKIFDTRVGRIAGYKFCLSSLLEVKQSTKGADYAVWKQEADNEETA